jgi:putative phosphoesterase
MKKILLLSDTHSHIDERILHFVSEADEVWHAGDIGDLAVTDAIAALKPLKAVYGNIDDHKARSSFPLDLKFDCEGMKVWITHIGGYPGKYNQRIREEIQKNPPQIFIAGHSHILKVQWDKSIQCMHLNPGACGISGFHQMRTMLRFSIDKGTLKDLEVIELGLRGKKP